MGPTTTILLEIPVILVKEGDYFTVSCDTLAIYAQSKDSKKAKDGFIKAIEHLFGLLVEQNKLEDFLYSKNVVKKHFRKVEVRKLTRPSLKLGHYTKWAVPAKASRALAIA